MMFGEFIVCTQTAAEAKAGLLNLITLYCTSRLASRQSYVDTFLEMNAPKTPELITCFRHIRDYVTESVVHDCVSSFKSFKTVFDHEPVSQFLGL